ncbi:diguanylate cyclase [Piscinibacter sakaiensis]|uniref:diguanylate cyclase domain-containing protein n=1 Tax=Piscinibacter sakaiensis TaxID=1547922 RepID=UPI00372A3C9B
MQVQRLSLLAVQVQRLGVAQASGLRGLAVPVDGLRPPPPQVEAAVCMQRLSGRVRQSDLPLRLDERRALVLLPGAGDQEAAVVATRLERLLVGTYGHEPWRVELTVSVGRASYPECGVTARDLVRAAQRGLEGVAAERS